MKSWITKNNYEIFLILSEKSNVYFVRKGDFSMLVDTAPFYERRKLVKKLYKLNVSHINYLLLTHTHYDHVQNAAYLQQKYQSNVLVHAAENDVLKNGLSPLPKGTIRATKLLMGSLKLFGIKIRHQPCEADLAIKENRFFLPEWDSDTYILHTPGHTTGSVSLIIDSEIAIVGDAMMGTYYNSITVPFADDPRLVTQSQRKLLKTNCSFFLPGHGATIERKLVEKVLAKRKHL